MTLLCCVCLTENVRFYNLNKTYLYQFYEKLLDYNVPYSTTCCCYICFALLKKCYKFVLQALKGNNILTKIEDSNFMLTNQNENIINLTTVKLNSIVIEGGSDVCSFEGNGKGPESKDLVKIEDFGTGSDNETDVKLDYISTKQSDSDEDLPLSELNTETDIIKEEKVDYKVLKRVNAQEFILTTEEQRQEMDQRAKSINYLNSPYKCDLCYRGFIDPIAYGKHRQKHDESSGDHKCEMCHLRYSTKRQLNSHYKAAHLRKFECYVCKEITHTRNQAKQHEEWHKGRTYTCHLCGKAFRKSSSYFTHVRKSHKSVHACSLCGDSFVSEHGLRMHSSKAHRTIEVDKKDEQILESYCKECNVQFKTSEAWERHALTNHYSLDSKSSCCPVCNQDVALEERVAHKRTHMDRHTSEHIYEKTPALSALSCGHCDSKFLSVHKLRAHMKRVHLGLKYDKNIVCEVCGKHCTSLATLKYHQRQHNGERPFPCVICGARFTCKENLRIHTRTHSGERPYSCVVCDKKFTQKPALNRHYRVHNGSKPYECQYCSKRFNQSSSLKSHVNTIHLKIPRNKKNKLC
ncbi:unnamed protein product [Pieris brassicae]|uniref:C2H2-type domain-containing protein n=1 Tax=Pieris brassicae TaxID=7116 RepID=A0A9P0XCP5_PIEBR|nr:unnamed protein product [Pieris brassicae]